MKWADLSGLAGIGPQFVDSYLSMKDKKRQEAEDRRRAEADEEDRAIRRMVLGIIDADNAYETVPGQTVTLASPTNLAFRVASTPELRTPDHTPAFSAGPMRVEVPESKRLRKGVTPLGKIGGRDMYHDLGSSLDYRTFAARQALEDASVRERDERLHKFDLDKYQRQREDTLFDTRAKWDREDTAHNRTQRAFYNALVGRNVPVGEFDPDEFDYESLWSAYTEGRKLDMEAARLANTREREDKFTSYDDYFQKRIGNFISTDSFGVLRGDPRSAEQQIRYEYLGLKNTDPDEYVRVLRDAINHERRFDSRTTSVGASVSVPRSEPISTEEATDIVFSRILMFSDPEPEPEEEFEYPPELSYEPVARRSIFGGRRESPPRSGPAMSSTFDKPFRTYSGPHGVISVTGVPGPQSIEESRNPPDHVIRSLGERYHSRYPRRRDESLENYIARRNNWIINQLRSSGYTLEDM